MKYLKRKVVLFRGSKGEFPATHIHHGASGRKQDGLWSLPVLHEANLTKYN